MNFYSTRKRSPDVNFQTALLQGIAPDGGLYMPRTIPQFTQAELAEKVNVKGLNSLRDVACMVMRKWLDSYDIPDEKLKPLITESFSFPIPLVRVRDYSVLELFHGQTMAFKDIAAGILARLIGYYVEKEDKTRTILVATSGDTGGAIAQAFSGIEHVKVVILYPEGKVSALQEEQLTRVGENVTSIAVKGVFDECQSFVKEAFQDPDLKELSLSSANSINIGRLLPQIIYYVWAYLQSEQEQIRFVIPSGNMGNATAALFAQRMGIPIRSLVIATNENDAAVEYYNTGMFRGKVSIQTLSTAMDIGNPNNFERILALLHDSHDAFRRFFTAIKVSDAQTVETIKTVYQKENYLMDFHTAVAYAAAEKTRVAYLPTVVISTASPLKFAKEMEAETGIAVDNARILKDIRKKEKRVIHSSSEYESIKKILLETK